MSEPRIVPPEEARRLVSMFEDRSMDDAEAYGNRDLAYTAAVLGEQREAALALHHPYSELTDVCAECDEHSYPCPTARALGVTE